MFTECGMLCFRVDPFYECATSIVIYITITLHQLRVLCVDARTANVAVCFCVT